MSAQTDYQSIIGLLGLKPESNAFREFSNTKKFELEDDGLIVQYAFKDDGFRLVFVRCFDCFKAAWFFTDTPSIRSGHESAYTGVFLNGVMPSDNRTTVQLKLRKFSTRSGTLSKQHGSVVIDSFEQDHLQIKFSFNRSEIIASVAVDVECCSILIEPSKPI